MLIRQRILHRVNQSLTPQDLIAHFIHGILHTGTVILGKDAHRDLPSHLPRLIKLTNMAPNIIHIPEPPPLPIRRNISTQHAVPSLWERGVLIPHEAPELRVCALQHRQAADSRADADTRSCCFSFPGAAGFVALAVRHVRLHDALFFPVFDKGVRVWAALDFHACPAVRHDVYVRRVDVLVPLDEVRAQNRCEELRGCNRMLPGEDIDGVFDRVGGYHHAVIGFCVSAYVGFQFCCPGVGCNSRYIDFALQKDADCHLNHRLHIACRVPMDFV